MLPRKYLLGVSAEPFEGLPEIFAVPHYMKKGDYRYICSYNDGKSKKGKIFQLLAKYGQEEDRGQWDLHHIVEGQHFADIDFRGQIQRLYKDELPCVLVHKNEHIGYNQLLHIKETDELFREVLPKDLIQRSKKAAANASNKANYKRL